jgi:hypothetical protein
LVVGVVRQKNGRAAMFSGSLGKENVPRIACGFFEACAGLVCQLSNFDALDHAVEISRVREGGDPFGFRGAFRAQCMVEVGERQSGETG